MGMSTPDGPEMFQALRFSDEEGKYVIKGPICNPRVPDEEMRVTINHLSLAPGTPVVCKGLKNATHLNGKIGEYMSRTIKEAAMWCASRTRV